MRAVRLFVGLIVIVSSVLFTGMSAASAQVPNSLSIGGQPTTVFKGLAVIVTLDVVCDPSLNIAFGTANVAEVSGHKITQGSGSFVNDFPGVPCTGSTQTLTVPVFPTGNVAFKNGTGLATADVTLFDPISFNLTDITAVAGVHIRK